MKGERESREVKEMKKKGDGQILEQGDVIR